MRMWRGKEFCAQSESDLNYLAFGLDTLSRPRDTAFLTNQDCVSLSAP